MSQSLDFESDQKLRLLTDALRAGPGSPEWRQAIEELKLGNGQAVEDERQLLLRVREDLASGRGYKEIRPGPNFTRKVIDAIDQSADSAPSNASTATLIAIAAALVMVAVVAVVGFMIWPRPAPPPAMPDLAKTVFVNTLESASFDEDIPGQFTTFGNLQL